MTFSGMLSASLGRRLPRRRQAKSLDTRAARCQEALSCDPREAQGAPPGGPWVLPRDPKDAGDA